MEETSTDNTETLFYQTFSQNFLLSHLVTEDSCWSSCFLTEAYTKVYIHNYRTTKLWVTLHRNLWFQSGPLIWKLISGITKPYKLRKECITSWGQKAWFILSFRNLSLENGKWEIITKKMLLLISFQKMHYINYKEQAICNHGVIHKPAVLILHCW